MPATQAYSQATQEFIDHLIENSHIMDDINYFIEAYGEDNFMKYFEEYCDYGEKYEYTSVDAFIKTFGLNDLKFFEDAYRGEYPNFRDFAQEMFEQIWSHRIPEEIEHYFDMDCYERDLRYEFYYVDDYVFSDY